MQHMQQNFLRTRPKAEKAAAEAEAAEESAAEKAAAEKAATGGAEPALAKPTAYRRQRSLRQKIRSSVVVETCIQTCIIVKEDQGSIGLDLQQSSGHRISIVRVKPDTPAARSVPPLVAGMAIVSVNGFPVLDAKVAAECIAKAGRGQMMLEVAPEATRSWLSRLRRASARQESVKGADEARMSGDEDSGHGAALAAEP
jgi:C-terminal processing protease CtpA/Prc